MLNHLASAIPTQYILQIILLTLSEKCVFVTNLPYTYLMFLNPGPQFIQLTPNVFKNPSFLDGNFSRSGLMGLIWMG